MTHLCATLTSSTTSGMIDEIRKAVKAGADMIELRLDYLSEHHGTSVRALMAEAQLRFPGRTIVTCRLAEEGGHWDADESGRISLMELAGLAGADYLDFEYEAWRRSANIRQKIGLVCQVDADDSRPRRQLILSKHDFERTPADLVAILDTLAGEPCHIVKLACKAEKITDSLTMLDALRISAPKRPTIAISMGEPGILARVLAAKCGAFLAFASLKAGKESAPGQISLADMRTLYRWGNLNEHTKVYGVIGCPVVHSMSPAILNAAFGEIGYNAVYLPLRIEPNYADFKAFVDGCIVRPWLDLRGASVTIPHKENLLRYVAERNGDIEPLARRIGAANTLCIEPGQRENGSDARVSAFNTDYRGAMDALCAGMETTPEDLKGGSVAVLGAGGAGRAIVAGLRDAGCAVTIYNRTADKARRLADEFHAVARPWEQRNDIEADVIINCTSIGMWPNVDESPLPEPPRSDRVVVFDTVYNPIETRLLAEARARGCRTIDGVSMFVNQAAAQFRQWTGGSAPLDAMRRIVLLRLPR